MKVFVFLYSFNIWLENNRIGLCLLVEFTATQVGYFALKAVLLVLDLLGDVHPAVFSLDNGALLRYVLLHR